MAKFRVTKFVRQTILGANIATIVAMLVTGFSYLVDPYNFPIIGLFGLVFPFFVVVNILFMLFWTFVYWRNIIYPFAGMVLCYVPVSMYVGLNRSQELPEGCIKVMSYNALSLVGVPGNELRRDSNEAVFYILRQDCDIVCLQEVSLGTLSEGMRAKIDSLYPYARVETREGNSQTILSKYEIVGCDSIPYESHGNFSVGYHLKTDTGNLLVISNHLESNGFSVEEKEQFGSMIHGRMTKHEMKQETKGVVAKLAEAVKRRNPQAKAVAEYVEQHRDERIILCGDFNEWPVSYTRNVIARNLTDCFIASGQGLGWSYTHNGMRVRIDNIMCSKNITPYGCYVDNSVHYSDHFPIVTWLKIEP